MNFSAPFIKRPVATTLLAVSVLLAGMIAFGYLPLASLPLVDLSAIQVSAALPGASTENMASSVATPLEKQILGGSLPSVRIDLNPQQVSHYGLGLQDVAGVISAQMRTVQRARSPMRTISPISRRTTRYQRLATMRPS
jgi:multidrug efflux pump